MSRRRTDQPPPDRLADLLGVAVPDVDGSAPTRRGNGVDPAPAQADPASGWVPGRADVELAAPPRRPRQAVPGQAGPRQVGPRDDGRHRRPTPPRPALLTVPVSLRGASVRPRRMAVLGLLLVLAVAAGVFGVRVAWARSSSQPEPVPAATTPARGSATGVPSGLLARSVPAAFAASAAGPTGAGGAGAGAPSVAPGAAGAVGAAGATATGVVVVHVVGAVVRSGVVRLALGSRVLDVVNAAGGPAPGADLPQLNLARVVADGEQIHVPRKGETLPTGGVPGAVGAGAAAGPGAAGGGVGAAGANAVPVDLNSADAATLDTLPGVGPVLAQRILDWRTEHGRFSSVDELGEVSGIGDKLLAQIGPKVRV